MGFLALALLGGLFGGRDSNYSSRAKRDQDGFGTSFKNLISPINSYGTCFSCDGSGKKTLDCKVCEGSGEFSKVLAFLQQLRELACPVKVVAFAIQNPANAVLLRERSNRQWTCHAENVMAMDRSPLHVVNVKEKVTLMFHVVNVEALGGIDFD